MKKITAGENHNSEPSLELANAFWRWFSFSVFLLLVAAAIPAFSADVFIDEGDSDSAATPVSTPPLAAVPAAGGKAPASEEIPPAGAGPEIDTSISGLEPSPPMDVAPAISEMDKSNAQKVNDLMATPAAGKKQAKKASKASASKKIAKASKKSSKKIAKKAEKKKKTTASKTKKKSKKTAEVKISKKKKSTKVAGAGKSKSSKRKIASVGKFAGGKYVTSSRSCALESAPGAGDSNGMTKNSRKLWVEDSGNTSYYKVYVKGGAAAFVARDCF